MPSRQPRSTLNDIKSNIDLAQSFAMTLSAFQSDRKTVYAVVRCLEIISEASGKLLSELKERHRHIQWAQIASAGNVYRHGYQFVRDEFVWHTLKDELGPLQVAVEEELSRLKDR